MHFQPESKILMNTKFTEVIEANGVVDDVSHSPIQVTLLHPRNLLSPVCSMWRMVDDREIFAAIAAHQYCCRF